MCNNSLNYFFDLFCQTPVQNEDLASHIESIKMENGGYTIDMNLPGDVEYFYAIEEEIITPA